ncbi:MAG: hypothetical protein AAB686_01965 [Patescibacteria group bacterium]
MNQIYSTALAQELIQTTSQIPTETLPPTGNNTNFVPPRDMLFTFILFLLPIAMLIIHIIFTLKYWRDSRIIFKILSSLVSIPLIFLSWGSIVSFSRFGLSSSESALLHYFVLAYYIPLFILFWIIKYFKQKGSRNIGGVQ